MPSRRGSPSKSKIAPLKKPVLHGYAAPWCRESEEQDPHTCIHCGGDMEPNPNGWFICLACLHTDRDAELAYDLALERGRTRLKTPKFRPRVARDHAPA